jgi:hypothetical protein
VIANGVVLSLTQTFYTSSLIYLYFVEKGSWAALTFQGLINSLDPLTFAVAVRVLA